jgi:hypothetical protein
VESFVKRTVFLLASVLAVAAGIGCSSDDEGSSGTGGACASDSRKDIYTAGLTKTTGSMMVRLVESIAISGATRTPGAPHKGTNELTVEILDANGAPLNLTGPDGKFLPGVTVTMTPWMPDHAHGSARKTIVTPSGNGRYTISDIWLSMAGLWQLSVNVTTASGSQEAMFQFCLDG